MNIMIAVPCMDSVPIQFCHSLAMMMSYNSSHGISGVLYEMIGSLIYQSRNQLVKDAMKIGADYILWLDSDMEFEPDIAERLLKHMEDKEMVSGLYFRRKMPCSPVLFKSYEIKGNGITWEGYDDYPKDSVFEIAGCGFGCVMMKTEVLYDVVLNYKSWFSPILESGEDMSFCYRFKELGHKIWCDSSIKLGHVGHVVIDEDFWFNTKGTTK